MTSSFRMPPLGPGNPASDGTPAQCDTLNPADPAAPAPEKPSVAASRLDHLHSATLGRARIQPAIRTPRATLLSQLRACAGKTAASRTNSVNGPGNKEAGIREMLALAKQPRNDEKTTLVLLERVVTYADDTASSNRLDTLTAVAGEIAKPNQDRLLAPRRIALFNRLADQCDEMSADEIAPLVLALVRARPWLGVSVESDAAFGRVYQLIGKLDIVERAEPLAELAKNLHLLTDDSQWQAFQAIASAPSTDAAAIAQIASSFNFLPDDVREEAFDLAFDAALRHPDNHTEALHNLGACIRMLPEPVKLQKFDKIALLLKGMPKPAAAHVALGLLTSLTHPEPPDFAPAAFQWLAQYLSFVEGRDDVLDAVCALEDIRDVMPAPQADLARTLARRIMHSGASGLGEVQNSTGS